jgi:diguanylate cyclase (GGDEF)-like protein
VIAEMLLAAAPAAGWATHAGLMLRRLHTARRDPVTGLLTRAGWTRRAGRTVKRPNASVMLLDLDRFKAINDRHGHAAGDAVLTATGARLTEWCQQHSGTAGRLGGDEFAIVAELDRYEAAAQVHQLQTALQQPVPWPGGPLQVGASIGRVRVAELPTRSLSAAMHEADRLMYEAKGRPSRGRRLLTALLGGTR